MVGSGPRLFGFGQENPRLIYSNRGPIWSQLHPPTFKAITFVLFIYLFINFFYQFSFGSWTRKRNCLTPRSAVLTSCASGRCPRSQWEALERVFSRVRRSSLVFTLSSLKIVDFLHSALWTAVLVSIVICVVTLSRNAFLYLRFCGINLCVIYMFPKTLKFVDVELKWLSLSFIGLSSGTFFYRHCTICSIQNMLSYVTKVWASTWYFYVSQEIF